MKAEMGRQRHITLAGKAWFEVARDESHPFVVEAGDLDVTVLGTGFEVSAYDTSGTWTVRVRHGRVRVEADTQRVELTAGERVVLDRATGRLTMGVPVTTETWGDRIVRFENAPMSEVAAELQRMFHVRVDLSTEALGRCRLTATFENEPIEQVLHVISGTFGLRVERPANDHYVLRGDGC
jgi:transmembrane sensor